MRRVCRGWLGFRHGICRRFLAGHRQWGCRRLCRWRVSRPRCSYRIGGLRRDPTTGRQRDQRDEQHVLRRVLPGLIGPAAGGRVSRVAGVDGDPLTYRIVQNGLLGNIEVDELTGAYTYTPTLNANGTLNLTGSTATINCAGNWTDSAGGVFNVGSSTVMEADNGPFVVGACVEVEGFPREDGVVDARKMETEERNECPFTPGPGPGPGCGGRVRQGRQQANAFGHPHHRAAAKARSRRRS